MITISIGDSDDMNHDNDDVMVSSLHHATLRNDTVVHDDGTLDIKRILFLIPYYCLYSDRNHMIICMNDMGMKGLLA